MTQKLGGFTFDDDGVLQTTVDAVSSPESLGGWAVSAAGDAHINDLGASAVPAGAHFLGGFAHDEDGVRYVTSDAPSGAFFHGGIAVRADGAMHVSMTGVQRLLRGWGMRDNGALNVSSLGATAYTLPDITYFADYDANAGVYQDSGTTPVASDGDPVGQIQDQSGNGRHITQTTAGAKPVYKTNQINGLPAILHAAGDVLQAATAADWKFLHDGTEFGVYIVWKTTSTDPNAFGMLMDTGASSQFDTGFGLSYDDRTASSINNVAYFQTAKGTAGRPINIATTNESVAGGYWHVTAARMLSSSGELTNDSWFGGYNTGAEGATPSSSNPTSALTVGGRYNNTQNMEGPWARIIIVSGAVSDADHEAIQEYLAYTYGRRAAFFDDATVIEHDTSGKDHNGMPGLGLAGSGRLVLGYTKRTSHLGFDGDLTLRNSDDGGDTFGAETTLWDHTTDGGGSLWYTTPRFTKITGGTILMAVGKQDGSGSIVDGIGYFKSTDSGVNWTGPTDISEAVFTSWSAEGGGILELANGDLLYPYYGYDTGDPATAWSCAVLKSTDSGVSWSALSLIADGTADSKQYTEPGLVQISNGNVLALIREETTGKCYQFVSTDSGATWDAGTVIATCSGMMSPLKLSTGEIIVPVRASLNNLQTRILYSGDEGVTWQQGRLFAESPNFTDLEMVYGQFQESNDGTIYLAYAQEDTTQSIADVMFSKAEPF